MGVRLLVDMFILKRGISFPAKVAMKLRSPIPCSAWRPERLRVPANLPPVVNRVGASRGDEY
jgi:hypothetical protein